jgi:CO/xanthine dehydrogenase FAD-binding subunit
MAELPLIQLGQLWVIDNYPYNSTHLLKSLEWLDRIAPKASEAVRLATLTHDMERAFGGPDAIPIKMNDRAYEKAHSDRSARIVGEWLRSNGAPADVVDDVEDLIRVHEWGGWPEADLVQAADSLSFLETNIDLMLGFAKSGKYPLAVVASKIEQMYERIQVPAARELARPMWEAAQARLGPDLVSSSIVHRRSTMPGVRPRYMRPESLDELFTMLHAHPDARLLAGGTDLLVRLRKGAEVPSMIVDLKRVTALRADVAQIGNVIRIGARTVITDVVESTLLRAHFPALIEAALVVGSVQIRNRATISGNICNASPAADTSPALIAYDAVVNLAHAGGVRSLPVEEFFTGPGRTVLAPGEIVESIDLPLPNVRSGSAFGRLTRRHGVDLAIVSVCCVVRESGDVRFALAAVGPRPIAVNTRQDSSLDDLLKYVSPISDLRGSDEYRRAMVPVLARRALKAALNRMHRLPGSV